MYLMEKITVDKKDYWYLQHKTTPWDTKYLTAYGAWRETLTSSCLFDSSVELEALAFKIAVPSIIVINATLFDGVVNYYCERYLEKDKLYLSIFEGRYDFSDVVARWALFTSKEDLIVTLNNLTRLEWENICTS